MKWKVLFILSLFASPARAAVIRYHFTGELESALGSLPAGTLFSGDFSYEQDQPVPVVPPPPAAHVASYASLSFSLVIGGNTFDLGAGGVAIWNGPPFDVFDLRPGGTATIGGLSAGVELILANTSWNLWDGLALPGSDLTVGDFPSPGTARLLLSGGAAEPVVGSLNSLEFAPVPEPSAAMLSAAGLMLLSRRRRMQQASATPAAGG